jgi:glycosyltransferase involved in cell wall biosynthesis
MSEINIPVFSIITPTCRRPLLLKRTINSVIRQTFQDFEHIIVDDANDQETVNLINEYRDERIVSLKHTSPRGAAGGYNSGIKISKGRFILFLDDDDEYLPSFLEKIYNHFSQADKKVGFIWTGISRIKDTDTGESLLYSIVWPTRFTSKEQGLIAATSIGNGYGVCIRRECIDIIGLYDESIITGQDTDFLFRLARRFDFETIPEVLVKIHQHSYSQLTGKNNNLLRLELLEKILNKNQDLLSLFPKLYNIHYNAVARLYYNLKLKQKGRKSMFSIIKNNPFHILNYTDLFFYEWCGKDSFSFYNLSRIKKIIQFMKVKYSGNPIKTRVIKNWKNDS